MCVVVFFKKPIQDFLARTARKNGVWIVSGTIPLESKDDDRVCAASLVYDDKGQVQARYDKMHLFDVVAGFSNSFFFFSADFILESIRFSFMLLNSYQKC